MANAITVNAFYIDGVVQSPSTAYPVLVDNIDGLRSATGDSNIAPNITEAAVHACFYDTSAQAVAPKLIFVSETVAQIAAEVNA